MIINASPFECMHRSRVDGTGLITLDISRVAIWQFLICLVIREFIRGGLQQKVAFKGNLVVK